MKIVSKPIKVVSWTEISGNINPVRFKITKEDGSNSVVRIDKVICIDKEKLAGNNMLVFKCQSVINGAERLYELKYELSTCRWMYLRFRAYMIDKRTLLHLRGTKCSSVFLVIYLKKD